MPSGSASGERMPGRKRIGRTPAHARISQRSQLTTLVVAGPAAPKSTPSASRANGLVWSGTDPATVGAAPSTCGGLRTFSGRPAPPTPSPVAWTTSIPIPSPGSTTTVFVIGQGSSRAWSLPADGPLVNAVPTKSATSGHEHERHARALRHRAELLHEIVGNRHAVAEPLGARRHLGVARDENGLGGIGALGAVEHVDHLVEVVLELALRAEGAGIDGQEKVADVTRTVRFDPTAANRLRGRARLRTVAALHHHDDPVASLRPGRIL